MQRGTPAPQHWPHHNRGQPVSSTASAGLSTPYLPVSDGSNSVIDDRSAAGDPMQPSSYLNHKDEPAQGQSLSTHSFASPQVNSEEETIYSRWGFSGNSWPPVAESGTLQHSTGSHHQDQSHASYSLTGSHAHAHIPPTAQNNLTRELESSSWHRPLSSLCALEQAHPVPQPWVLTPQPSAPVTVSNGEASIQGRAVQPIKSIWSNLPEAPQLGAVYGAPNPDLPSAAPYPEMAPGPRSSLREADPYFLPRLRSATLALDGTNLTQVSPAPDTSLMSATAGSLGARAASTSVLPPTVAADLLQNRTDQATTCHPDRSVTGYDSTNQSIANLGSYFECSPTGLPLTELSPSRGEFSATSPTAPVNTSVGPSWLRGTVDWSTSLPLGEEGGRARSSGSLGAGQKLTLGLPLPTTVDPSAKSDGDEPSPNAGKRSRLARDPSAKSANTIARGISKTWKVRDPPAIRARKERRRDVSSHTPAVAGDSLVRPYACGVPGCKVAWCKIVNPDDDETQTLIRTLPHIRPTAHLSPFCGTPVNGGNSPPLATYLTGAALTKHVNSAHPQIAAVLQARRRAERIQGLAMDWRRIRGSDARPSGSLGKAAAQDVKQEEQCSDTERRFRSAVMDGMFCCSIPGCMAAYPRLASLLYHIQVAGKGTHGHAVLAPNTRDVPEGRRGEACPSAILKSNVQQDLVLDEADMDPGALRALVDREKKRAAAQGLSNKESKFPCPFTKSATGYNPRLTALASALLAIEQEQGTSSRATYSQPELVSSSALQVGLEPLRRPRSSTSGLDVNLSSSSSPGLRGEGGPSTGLAKTSRSTSSTSLTSELTEEELAGIPCSKVFQQRGGLVYHLAKAHSALALRVVRACKAKAGGATGHSAAEASIGDSRGPFAALYKLFEQDRTSYTRTVKALESNGHKI